MNVYEFNSDNEVNTPYGRGVVWYMVDYGWNGSTTYTVILQNGKLVTCQQGEITHVKNVTFGRGDKKELNKILNECN